MASRRGAKNDVFFVPPHIASFFWLTPGDLCWAFRNLEGKLVATVGSTRGKFRKVRLLPQWEERHLLEGEGHRALDQQEEGSTSNVDQDGESVAVVIDRGKALARACEPPQQLDPHIEKTLREIALGTPTSSEIE